MSIKDLGGLSFVGTGRELLAYLQRLIDNLQIE